MEIFGDVSEGKFITVFFSVFNSGVSKCLVTTNDR